MPNRILRDGILTSERVNRLSPHAELFYRRLMSVVDDFGRYTAHPTLLRAACYPLLLDRVKEEEITKHLAECADVGLIITYEVDSKKYLQILDFRQQVRAQASKYPPPPVEVRQMPGICTASATQMRSRCLADDKQLLSNAHLDGVGDEDVFGDGDERVLADGHSPPEIELWNSKEGLPKVKSLSSARWKRLRARRKDPFFVANLPAAIDRIVQSNFLMGKNGRGWIADFDWLLQPDSVAKVMEGKYDNREITFNVFPKEQLDAVQKLILNHIANPNGRRYSAACSQADRDDLKQLRQKESELTNQIARAKR